MASSCSAKGSSQNAPYGPLPTVVALTVNVKTFSDRAATSYGSVITRRAVRVVSKRP